MDLEPTEERVVWVVDQNRPTRRIITAIVKGGEGRLYLVHRRHSNFYEIVSHESIMFTLEEGI